MGVEVRARHGVAFFVGQTVRMAVNGGVNTEGEDVLVVSGEDTWVDHSSPRDGDALVNRLSADDSRSADFIGNLASLVEQESQDVLVIRDSDNRLNNQLAVPGYGCAAGAVIGVFPADTVVLLVDADDILHRHGLAVGVGEDSAEIVNGA